MSLAANSLSQIVIRCVQAGVEFLVPLDIPRKLGAGGLAPRRQSRIDISQYGNRLFGNQFHQFAGGEPEPGFGPLPN